MGVRDRTTRQLRTRGEEMLGRASCLVLFYMHHKGHGTVATATEVATFPMKVPGGIGGDHNLGQMTFSYFRVHVQAWNNETMGNILGGQYELDCFSLLDRDLRRCEGESLGMNFNDAGCFLCARRPGWSDTKTK